MLLPSLLPVGLLSLISAAVATRETFHESLSVSPLQDGKLLSSFQFSLAGPDQRDALDRHHTLLPGSLLALLDKYGVSSLSLTLSSGRYLSQWPTPTDRGVPASGVELLAYLELYEGESSQDELKRWSEFRGALSGMFCTGLLDAQHSSPKSGFEPNGHLAQDSHRLYRVLTPRLSATCTESLTPFLALLPCRSKAGLATLINPFRLFDGDWTLLAVHFGRLADQQQQALDLVVGSVVDPVRQSRLEGHVGSRDFSFAGAYGRTLEKACPVAQSSTVTLQLPRTTTPFKVLGGDSARPIPGDKLEWDVTKAALPLDVGMTFSEPSMKNVEYPPVAPISVRRLLRGVGQERGSIGLEVVNHLNRTVEVDIVETWDCAAQSHSSSSEETFDISTVLANYEAAVPRQKPTTLELRIAVPPSFSSSSLHTGSSGKVTVLVPYESAYLWYTEYSSDAHRGVEFRGAMVSLVDDGDENDDDAEKEKGKEKGRRGYRTYTSTTLVSLPTPDFSMPYNVIILTSTVIALFFGNVVNRMLREWRVVDLSPPPAAAAPVRPKAE